PLWRPRPALSEREYARRSSRNRSASRSRTISVSRTYRHLAVDHANDVPHLFIILPIQKRVHEAVQEAARRQFGIAEVPTFAVETPPTRALGDLAITLAFQLARTLRKAPRAIAQDLSQAIGSIPGVERIVATPNGYLNLYLDRKAFLIPRIRQEVAPEVAT